MKKTLIFTLLLSLILTFGISAYAQEAVSEDVTAKIVSLSDKLSEALKADKIVYMGDEKSRLELTEKNGVFTRKPIKGDVATASDVSVFSLTTEETKNEIYDIDLEFDFTDADGKEVWNGFKLRAKDPDKFCWLTPGYVIIVKKDRVEIQAYADSQKWMLNREYEIKEGVKTNVKFGAIDTKDGVFVFIQIGDEVFSALDEDNMTLDAGYTNIEWRGDFKAYKTTADEKYSVPMIKLDYSVNDASVKESISYVKTEKAEKREAKESEWYLSTADYTTNVGTYMNFSDAFTLIDGEKNDTLMVMQGDIGLYANAAVTMDNGVKVWSYNHEYISPVEYVIEKGFAGLLDCNKAYAKGKYFTYDGENSLVSAFEQDGNVFVPVRAVVEAFDHWVGWDNDRRIVFLNTRDLATDKNDLQSYDSSFKIGDLGWSYFRMLMGSNMVAASFIDNGRAMLVYSDVALVLDFKNNNYDEKTGVITFSDIPLNLTDENLKELADLVEFGPIE